LDNYERETGRAENVTAEEKHEMSAFLDAVTRTDCMRFCFEWLKKEGVFQGEHGLKS
jgi:hypothetical protein